jgi:hypothetical protein
MEVYLVSQIRKPKILLILRLDWNPITLVLIWKGIETRFQVVVLFWKSFHFWRVIFNIFAKESSRSNWGSNPRPTATPPSTKYLQSLKGYTNLCLSQVRVNLKVPCPIPGVGIGDNQGTTRSIKGQQLIDIW